MKIPIVMPKLGFILLAFMLGAAKLRCTSENKPKLPLSLNKNRPDHTTKQDAKVGADATVPKTSSNNLSVGTPDAAPVGDEDNSDDGNDDDHGINSNSNSNSGHLYNINDNQNKNNNDKEINLYNVPSIRIAGESEEENALTIPNYNSANLDEKIATALKVNNSYLYSKACCNSPKRARNNLESNLLDVNSDSKSSLSSSLSGSTFSLSSSLSGSTFSLLNPGYMKNKFGRHRSSKSIKNRAKQYANDAKQYADETKKYADEQSEYTIWARRYADEAQKWANSAWEYADQAQEASTKKDVDAKKKAKQNAADAEANAKVAADNARQERDKAKKAKK